MNHRVKHSITFFAVACSTALYAQQPPAEITVQVDKPLHSIGPNFYGLMTEEINYSYDGGLYAEMMRNRTFHDHGFGGVAHWNLDNIGTARSTMEVDAAEGPSAALPQSLRVDIAYADSQNVAAIRNEGYWGMALAPETSYTGSLYAKAGASGFGPLTVSLVSDVTGKIVATATTMDVSGDWKKYDFALRTGNIAASTNYHLTVAAGHSGKLWLSLVSVFPPTYKGRVNGNRTDLMELMAGMHPRFLRLPGGNYLEGDQIDERFDWKTTIGPLVDRPTHRSPWNYQSSMAWDSWSFWSGPRT